MSMHADISLDFLHSVTACTCTIFSIDIYKNKLTKKTKNLLVFVYRQHLIRAPLNISFRTLIYHFVQRAHAMLSFLCSVYSEYGSNNGAFLIYLQLHHDTSHSHIQPKSLWDHPNVTSLQSCAPLSLYFPCKASQRWLLSP